MTRDDVFVRQQALLARSDQLRTNLATHSQVLQKPLAAVDATRNSLHWLRQHPEWPIGAAVALVVARPRRILTWSQRVWLGWRLFKRAKKWIDAQ